MEMSRLEVSKIRIGSCYSEPVFFDDGKNMFLPAGKEAKSFHVSALSQWKIPYLLTSGHEIDPKDYVASLPSDNSLIELSSDLGGLEEIHDLKELEEL